MIDAWVANRPPGLDPERQLDDRWAAEGLMIRKAIAREAPLPDPWKDDVEPALLR